MTTHLSDEQLNLLHAHQLRGSDFVKALHHLEVCEDCHQRMPKHTTQEVFQTILGKESEPIQAKQKPALIPLFGRSFAPLAVGLLLAILGGAIFLFFNLQPANIQNQASLVQQKDDSTPIIPIFVEDIETDLQPTQNLAKTEKTVKPKVVAQKPTNEKANPKQSRVIPQPIKKIAPNTNISNEIAQNPKVRLVWGKVKDAFSYEITVFDQNYNEIAKENVTANSFQFKESLEKGNSYFWKLTAYNSNGEMISTQNSETIGTFAVAKANKKQQLKRLEKSKQDDLAVLNFMIEKGMLQEAKTKLQKLSAQKPYNAQYKRLTKKVDDLIAK